MSVKRGDLIPTREGLRALRVRADLALVQEELAVVECQADACSVRGREQAPQAELPWGNALLSGQPAKCPPTDGDTTQPTLQVIGPFKCQAGACSEEAGS